MESYVKDYRNGLEVISFKDKPKTPVRGLVKVELFNAYNGKKILEAKTENLITSLERDHQIWKIKEDFFRGCPGTLHQSLIFYSTISLYGLLLVQKKITLFPDLGNQIGWCDKSTYSGSDTLRGTINTAESYATSDRVHWVFDWPTHSGNGTFQTITWCDLAGDNVKIVSVSSLNSPDSNPYGLTWDGQYLWLSGRSTQKIYKINPSNGSIVSSFNSPDTYSYGLIWDGQYLWLAGDNTNKIYKLNPSDGSVVISFNSPDSDPYGLTWDGQYLWLSGRSTQKIYKINPSNGSTVSSFNSPDSIPYGLAWNGQYLWLYGANTRKIYKINPSNGSIISSFNSPLNPIFCIAWIGQYLWLAAADNSGKIYKQSLAIGAQTLLASPVTKTSTNTMKIQYDFVFEE